MRDFNPDRFFKRRTIFSSENFGPGDQNSRIKIPVTATDHVRNLSRLSLQFFSKAARQNGLFHLMSIPPPQMNSLSGGFLNFHLSRGYIVLCCTTCPGGSALLHYMSRGSALLQYMSRGFLQ